MTRIRRLFNLIKTNLFCNKLSIQFNLILTRQFIFVSLIIIKKTKNKWIPFFCARFHAYKNIHNAYKYLFYENSTGWPQQLTQTQAEIIRVLFLDSKKVLEQNNVFCLQVYAPCSPSWAKPQNKRNKI